VDEAVANAEEIRQDLSRGLLPQLKMRHRGLDYSIEGAGKERAESMRDVEQGFLLALFLIYVLLAIPFASFSQPFLVMTAIPFGIVGAFLGHLVMGYDLSILSFFGIVGLSGVVVNDSLILISAINRLREQGVPLKEAVLQGGILRFRAVILTTLTTFAGLAPLIFERSVQARFLIPMALSLGFGVLFATVITLVLIPCGYVILEDLKKKGE
ncbi:MAG TPA: efflux RND transporter permease subunit, partial [Desulfobacterales bacterium]|nr:efflux RND transporter permease subunit [Desulfobacterales bacterium]